MGERNLPLVEGFRDCDTTIPLQLLVGYFLRPGKEIDRRLRWNEGVWNTLDSRDVERER